MLIVLKLCVTALVLVTSAEAQVDICDDVPVLMATSMPQILTSVSIETNVYNLVVCSVQITVSAGSSLMLNFKSITSIGFDPIVISLLDSSFTFRVQLLTTGQSRYIISGSASVSIEYDILPSTTFVMEYRETTETTENICTMMPLVFADTTVQVIATPNFGFGPYFDNHNCQVTIQSNVPGAREVKVEVTNHVMECPYDHIIICDGVDCHNLCNTNQRIFRGNSISVRFFSDGCTSFDGMRLEYITVSDFSDWTPWVSKGCCEYRDCGIFVRDTRRRNCLIDVCMDELVQERTRVCSKKCGDCLLP